MIRKCSSLFFLLTISIQLLEAEIISKDCPPSTEEGGKNYTVIKEKKTFDNAMEGCKKRGLRLATVENEEEQRQLEALLKQQDDSTFFRLGGSDRQQPGVYQWESSGEPVLYTSWKHKQPDRYHKHQHADKQRECICVSSSSPNGKWCVWECSLQLNYICENQHVKDTYSKCE